MSRSSVKKITSNALSSNPKIPYGILEEIAEVVSKERCIILAIAKIMAASNASEELKQQMYSVYQDSFNSFNESKADFKDFEWASDLEIGRIKWTTDIARAYLIKTYDKRSCLHLTDEQLIEFWKYLSSLPTSK